MKLIKIGGLPYLWQPNTIFAKGVGLTIALLAQPFFNFTFNHRDIKQLEVNKQIESTKTILLQFLSTY